MRKGLGTGMVTIWLGVLLFFVGVLYLAAQAIWPGRLSEWRARSGSAAGATLEPRERGGGFGLATN